MSKRQTRHNPSATSTSTAGRRRWATPPPPEPVTLDQVELLSIPDVAQKLKVSRKHVYHLIKRKGLPSCLVGEKLRVPLVKLHHWIEQREQPHAS
ncbi:MAG TPA: helix-turn-helix domain-containing protein [Ktedonobacteraceae bacterium]|nr:helix-turn-helix domain-containing protein [Ktedonobacteraceae bacterium]